MDTSYQDSDRSVNAPFGTVFKSIFVGFTQLLGITLIVIAAVWLNNYCGGFQWSTADLIFNYHPLFMLVGMVFLLGNAITVHRIFQDMKRQSVKILHACLLVLSMVFTSFGLAAVFTSSNMSGSPNLYSLHSWMGLSVIILFLSQWVAGLVILLLNRTGYLFRVNYKPVHTFFGFVIFAMAVATALLGLFSYVQYEAGADYANLPTQGVMVNCIGLMLVAFAIMIGFIVTNNRFRLPESDKEFSELAR